jgi:hypothetical protein
MKIYHRGTETQRREYNAACLSPTGIPWPKYTPRFLGGEKSQSFDRTLEMTPRGVAGIMVAGTPAAGIPATFSGRQGFLCASVSQAKRVVYLNVFRE